jgi:2-polyprenyl-6-methoxyphenol hydroxylase-like FAD-dependent oxidoreductase
MTFIIKQSHFSDYLLVDNTLANNEIDKSTLAAVKRLRCLVDYLPSASLDHKRIKMLCNAVDFRITAAALNTGLYFRVSKPLAIISGAGIAGLAASFKLRARGFNVVIAEKRKCFSRFNVINLNIETQLFLKEINLLEKFERFVASRIKEHRYVLVEKGKSTKRLALSDVSGLQLGESISFEPQNFNKLFDQDGIYSVPIGMLQTFLAKNALQAGVSIFSDVTVRILSRTQAGGISKVQITADRALQPDLFFIAEGAHSTTACELGMRTRKVTNVCTGEKWIFGNMDYSGEETFVVSLIDASEKTLRIANVIFNAKSKVINIAVTSDKDVSQDGIREQILQTAHQVFAQKAFPLEEMHSALLTTVSNPVHVINRTSFPFSMGNVFCMGDSAGSSSPLAGLGGTLGLTLVPLTVRKLLDDYENSSKSIHKNFNELSEAYTTRWIKKSESIKRFCIGIFEKEHSKN